MAAEAQIKGWCPGAWRPMASGDGLVVRVRPCYGALERAQVLALCDAAQRWGSGVIELTNRGNIQLRGVGERDWSSLLAALIEAGLVEGTPEHEARRNILVAPDWQPDDDTHRATRLLLARLAELPALPAKVGFAVDAGKGPILANESADFRIERASAGELLVRAEGRERGTAVATVEAAVTLLIRLAHWFVASGGRSSGRVNRHRCPLPEWAPERVTAAPSRPPFDVGDHPLGAVYGLRFGQVTAAELRQAVARSGVENVRVTPWRRLLLEGASLQPLEGLLTDNRAPELVTDACPGAPHCEQATVATRDLAAQLAGRVTGRLHVSGCAKGCARRQAADTCVVGREGRYDLIFRGRADGSPHVTGLTASQVRDYFGVE